MITDIAEKCDQGVELANCPVMLYSAIANVKFCGLVRNCHDR